MTGENKDIPLAHITDERTLRTITDQKLLYRVARHHHDKDLRCVATGMLESQEQLVRIARTDRAWQVRDRAASRIADKETLREILETDEAWQVREMADARLHDTDPPPHDEDHPMAWLWEDPW